MVSKCMLKDGNIIPLKIKGQGPPPDRKILSFHAQSMHLVETDKPATHWVQPRDVNGQGSMVDLE